MFDELEELFDENNNMHIPIDRVLDNLMERNKQLTLEIATLQAGNQMLREKIMQLVDRDVKVEDVLND